MHRNTQLRLIPTLAIFLYALMILALGFAILWAAAPS
jgi:hypothetical protein